jgi:putative membrane protein
MWDHMMEWGGGWGPGWGLFGLMHILWWVLILLGVIALVRWGFGRQPRGSGRPEQDRALAILRERYARGEIEKAEFEERQRDLRS